MPAFQRQVARALLQINAVGFSLHQPITFKSGILSPVYVDNRRLPYHPAQWRVVIEGLQELITEHQIGCDVIAGVAVGGVPHSAALGYVMQKPSVFVRKEAKGHGEQKLVEGGDVANQRVLLVEDMVTTGGSSLAGVTALRAEGAIVNDLLIIVSYGFEEARQAFSQANVMLHTLTSFGVIMEEAGEMGKFAPDEAAAIQDWFHDPHGWAGRHSLA